MHGLTARVRQHAIPSGELLRQHLVRAGRQLHAHRLMFSEQFQIGTALTHERVGAHQIEPSPRLSRSQPAGRAGVQGQIRGQQVMPVVLALSA